MLKIGQINPLVVVGEFPFGYQLLHPEDERPVVLAEAVESPLAVDSQIEAMVYTGENGQLTASLAAPKITTGQVKVLKAVGVTDFAAFFDWGLPRDLMVPRQNQASPVSQGMVYPVYLYFDEATQRLLGSTKLHHHLSESGVYYSPGQEVELIVCGQTDLGYKVVINQTHLGLVFASDAFKKLKVGDETTGFIKQVREDGKIDVVLQQVNATARDSLQQAILDDLEAHDGFSTLTDKSPPEEIYARFNVSKAAYKRALGALYKQHKIQLDKQKVTLLK
ncbi:CvfB family protein [Alteromonas gilva]|uniref:Conserved virulence factor B-like winged helix domain-containing protein n=1 Tax=Alteromonas gilva TaxID=2987522 RepID=A0ABT5L2F1_9ALTE|nr:hypothetical protein [Alteromonas gilva]MDC8831229.1 hypothetical protein [Alteromonas gilva]